MRRSLAWPSSIVLAVVTGAVLSQVVGPVMASFPETGQSDLTSAVAHRYYDAINEVLRTGDPSALDDAVSSDLIEHAALPGVATGRAGLGEYLVAVHAFAPAARILIAELTAVGDRAIATVTVQGLDQAAFLGAPLAAAPAVWSRTDVVRVVERRVVEHWSDTAGLVSLQVLGAIPTGARLPTEPGLAFERVTFRPGDRAEGPARETRLLRLESGTLTVALAADSAAPALVATGPDIAAASTPRPAAAGTTLTLSPGELVALPVSSAYTLRNDGPAPATALVAAIFAADEPTRSAPSADPAVPAPPSPWPSAIATQSLAGGTASGLPEGRATARLGWVTLSSGASLPPLAAPGAMLLSVEAGSVDYGVTAGTAWVRTGTNGSSQDTTTGTLDAGDGALLSTGVGITVRNTGDVPAVVLLLTLSPDN
jgi:predicted SnoaL-like aldol condensation-catalyzing enzyme